MKNIVMAIGVLCIIVFISLLVIGIRVVSSIFVYVFGFLAVLALIGFIIYFIGKSSGKRSNRP